MTSGTATQDPTTRTGTTPLVRPRYAPGLMLMDTDLEAAVVFHLERSRMILRTLLGSGVVCGLRVSAKLKLDCQRLVVTVGCGLALDGFGDPIELGNPVVLKIEKRCGEWPADRLWVVLRRRTWNCEPRSTYDCCEETDGTGEPTRIQDGYALTLATKEPCLGWVRPDEAHCAPGRDESDEEREDRLAQCMACPPCTCDSDAWVLLAMLRRQVNDGQSTDPDHWVVDHRGRRWLRPVLQADPLGDLQYSTRGGAPVHAGASEGGGQPDGNPAPAGPEEAAEGPAMAAVSGAALRKPPRRK